MLQLNELQILNTWISVHENYYQKIQPRAAWVLERAVQRLDNAEESNLKLACA